MAKYQFNEHNHLKFIEPIKHIFFRLLICKFFSNSFLWFAKKPSGLGDTLKETEDKMITMKDSMQ